MQKIRTAATLVALAVIGIPTILLFYLFRGTLRFFRGRKPIHHKLRIRAGWFFNEWFSKKERRRIKRLRHL